jgi:hypothetical protein
MWLFSTGVGGDVAVPESDRALVEKVRVEIQECLNNGWRPTTVSQCACGYNNQNVLLTMVFEDQYLPRGGVPPASASDDITMMRRVIESASVCVVKVFTDEGMIEWLVDNNFRRLGDLALCTESDLLKRRGFKTEWLPVLRVALSEYGLSFTA